VDQQLAETSRAPVSAWIMLLLTALFWAGNVVASRNAVGELSPMVLVTIRWGTVTLVMLTFAWKPLVTEWPLIRKNWVMISLMGIFGFTGYQALYFTAAQYTSGMHLAILQGVAPAFIFAGARIFYGTPIGLMRGIGLVMTMLGVAIVATHGEPLHLDGMDLNVGDIAMLGASIFYAGYTVALRSRPAISAFAFFTALSIVSTIASLPLLAWEIADHAAQWPTMRGWVVIGYIVIFPSLLAQIFFIRGVAAIGPGRASLFYNLVPTLGAIMAVTLLGEPFALYHGVGLALSLGGVAIAEFFGVKK
jgi:drug/metabolite transporter (DMT)-like permease